jgi:hypothetical protein
MAKDYRAMAERIDARGPIGRIAVEKCSGIALLLLTAADDMEDLKLPGAST